jgi:hypothetical protein
MAGQSWLIGGAVSLGLHGAAWLLSPSQPPMIDPPREPLIIEMPIEPPEPLAEPRAPAAEPEEPPAAPAEAAPPTPKAAAKAAAPALPAPAQAGKTMVAADSAPTEVADFTMVQGLADSYAGGTTTALGTNDHAVVGAAGDGRGHGQQAASRGQAPVAVAAAAPALDLSKPASPAGGNWSCSHLFPTDPDAPDQAAVTLVVEVDVGGRPTTIRVARDPGFGFGEAARRCAHGQTFTPARGPDGTPLVGRTRPFVVRFSR